MSQFQPISLALGGNLWEGKYSIGEASPSPYVIAPAQGVTGKPFAGSAVGR